MLSIRAFPALLALIGCFCSFQQGYAETISFKTLLSEAEQKSFDLKITEETILVRQAQSKEAEADYYPQLSLGVGSEFVHVFTEDADLVSVGDAIIANDSSGFKHSLIARLRYNLFDFGVRKLSVAQTRRNVLIAKLQKHQSAMDMYVEILQRYVAGLKLQKQIQVTTAILDRLSSIFQLSKELKCAGTVGRQQVGAAALNLAETLSRLDELKIQFQAALSSLSYFTQKYYRVDDVHLIELPHPKTVRTEFNPVATPDIQVYVQEIANKEAELAIAKRSMWPKLSLQGAYRMVGSDASSFGHSLTSLNSRDTSVTLYLEWPLFMGFQNRAKKMRLKHEIASLFYQKQKKIFELEQEHSDLLKTFEAYRLVKENRHQQRVKIAQERADANHLAALQITDQISFHIQTIELLRQKMAVDLWQVDFAAAAQQLNLIARVWL